MKAGIVVAALMLIWVLATAVIAMALFGGETQPQEEKWSGYPAIKK